MGEESERPRTATRLRAEAPAGYQVGGGAAGGVGGAEGRKTIGRYEVIKTIGKGAMGIVYKARDPLLDRVVAVKTISSPQTQGRRVRSAFLERFQREAKAAAKMQHPAIVTIFDVGVDEDLGAPFMVLEYLPGESLADRLDRVRIPLARCVSIALDLASALAFAHRQRIVHRDVKPANVLHAGDNRWKLADFGIARMPDSDLTQVGIFMGTPGYSPPEAIREGRYTAQADVFAWGACMYELLSGRIPYEGPDTKTTNSYVVQGNAPSPQRYDASIPEPLAAVVMHALQPSAHARFKDGAEAEASLREAWDRCLMQAIVQPAVLAMDETPHEKVGARMHEIRGAAGMPSRPPAAPPPLPASSRHSEFQDETAVDGPLRIESATTRGDDDPTTVVVREDVRGVKRTSANDSTSLGVLAPPPPPATAPVPRSGAQSVERRVASFDIQAEELSRDTLPQRPRFGQSMMEANKRGRASRVLIAMLVGLLLLGVVAAVLWRTGVIKLPLW